MAKNAWEEWKEKQRTIGRNVSPLDFFRQDTEYSDPAVQDVRYAICESCPELRPHTKQCKKCGCFMKLKVKLADAACPLGKW